MVEFRLERGYMIDKFLFELDAASHDGEVDKISFVQRELMSLKETRAEELDDSDTNPATYTARTELQCGYPPWVLEKIGEHRLHLVPRA